MDEKGSPGFSLKTFSPWLPLEYVVYRTELTPDEAIVRLMTYVQPKRRVRYFGPSSKEMMPYEGKIEGKRFKINRIIRGRNSFLPLILGTIGREDGCTIISVKMRPVHAVIVFMTFWLGVVGILGIVFLVAMISNMDFGPAGLFPLGMFAFGYGLMMLGFKGESKIARADLKRFFDAE